MKPDKIENHIKSRLENREIKPSSDLWQQLESRLDKSADRPERKNRFIWIGIASTLVLLIISMFVFQMSDPDQSNEPAVQIVQNEKEPVNTIQEESNRNEESRQNQTENINPVNYTASSGKNSINQTEITEPVYALEEKKTVKIINPVLTDVEIYEPQEAAESIESDKAELAVIHHKDSVPGDNIAKQNKKYIDADALLYSVEFKETMEQTKTEKVLTFIQDIIIK